MRSGSYEYLPREIGDDISAAPGLYKTKIVKGGAFIPLEVMEMCERDEAGHIETDVTYRVLAWPEQRSDKCFRWDYFELKPFFLRPITKDEFQWMMTLKTI